MECKRCQGLCIKKGCRKKRQKYRCKVCGLYQLKTYHYRQCTKEDERMLVKLNNEGVGINSMARITGISKAHVVNKLKQVAHAVNKPLIMEDQQEYEVDEMHTYIGNKSNTCYIGYAINKATKQVIDFVVGSRTKENLKSVIDSLNKLNPKKIFTDKLNIYPGLIEKTIHTVSAYSTNHIERYNLTLRTHLKRLTRKTLSYSKSAEMLKSCLRIYFWFNKQLKAMAC